MLDSNKHPHFKKALYMSFMFQILYIPFYCVQNLASTLQKEGGFGNLGFTVLAILYLTSMIGAIITPGVVKSFGIRVAMVVGAIGASTVVFC